MSFSILTVPHFQAPALHSPITASDLPSHLSSLPAQPLDTHQTKSSQPSTNMINWQFKPPKRKDTAHQYPSQTTSIWLSAAQAVWIPVRKTQANPLALTAGSSTLTLAYKFPSSPPHLQSSHLAQVTADQTSSSVKTATTPAPSARLQPATHSASLLICSGCWGPSRHHPYQRTGGGTDP